MWKFRRPLARGPHDPATGPMLATFTASLGFPGPELYLELLVLRF